MFENFFRKEPLVELQQEVFGLAGLTKPKKTLANPALAGLVAREKELKGDLTNIRTLTPAEREERRVELVAIATQKEKILGADFKPNEGQVAETKPGLKVTNTDMWGGETEKRGANAGASVLEFKKPEPKSGNIDGKVWDDAGVTDLGRRAA